MITIAKMVKCLVEMIKNIDNIKQSMENKDLRPIKVVIKKHFGEKASELVDYADNDSSESNDENNENEEIKEKMYNLPDQTGNVKLTPNHD